MATTHGKPLLYRIIRVTMIAAMRVFFQKVELRHGENVPNHGPVIFVANHPNSIMDALVLGVVTKRKVNYLGHAGLFSNRFKAWFLKSSGVIPIYRREDTPDRMPENVAAFEACYQALEQGETIGIFPEGTSDMLRKVKKVKTGAARIILEAERRRGYELGIQVIPVGLYFFSRSRFRSRVLVNVGRPLELRHFFELNEQDNYEAVQALTSEIQRQLEKLTVNIRHEELDPFVRDIELLFRDELSKEVTLPPTAKKSSAVDFYLIQKIAECVEYYYKNDRKRLRDLMERVSVYQRKLQRLHLKDTMLKEPPKLAMIFRASAVKLLLTFLGSPFALYGIINNAIPYFITETLAKRFIDDRTKILSALLLGGTAAFAVFYTIQTLLVWNFLGLLWANAYLVSLPLSGFFALAYIKQVRADQELLSLSFFMFTNRHLLNKLRRERRRLVAEVNSIKEEYLNVVGVESLKAH